MPRRKDRTRDEDLPHDEILRRHESRSVMAEHCLTRESALSAASRPSRLKPMDDGDGGELAEICDAAALLSPGSTC